MINHIHRWTALQSISMKSVRGFDLGDGGGDGGGDRGGIIDNGVVLGDGGGNPGGIIDNGVVLGDNGGGIIDDGVVLGDDGGVFGGGSGSCHPRETAQLYVQYPE
jgi:hypothetical protein